MSVGQITRPTREHLNKPQPVDGRGVIGNRVVNVEDPHDMVGHVTDIDILLAQSHGRNPIIAMGCRVPRAELTSECSGE
jgi:hypothetical protein